MTDPQPTPPLPDEIEAAIEAVIYGTKELPVCHVDAIAGLRQAIATALAQAREDSALRERAERLRIVTEAVGDYAWHYLQPGDLADDLMSAQEAVT